MKSTEKNNFFTKHPKKTILIFIVIICLFFDFTIARTFKLIFGYPWYERTDRKKIAAEKSYRIRSKIYHHDLAKNKTVNDANWGTITYRVFTDSLGFKNESPKEISIKSDKYRVLFIGDSFTEGDGVEYLDTFVGLISSELSKSGIEVLNAGVASYSPIIYWRKTKYLIEEVGLTFDELVVFIDFGDADNEPSYILGEDGNINGYINEETDINNDSIKDNTTLTLGNLIKNNSILLFYLKNKAKSFLSPNVFKEKNSSPPKFQTFQLSSGLNMDGGLKGYYNHRYAAGLKSMGNYMDMLHALLEKHKIKMTVAVYPWPDQILSNDLNNIHVSYWEDWSNKHNVKFLNYFPCFIKLKQDELENQITVTKYFIPGDLHWNEAGHTLIAENFLLSYRNNSENSIGICSKDKSQE